MILITTNTLIHTITTHMEIVDAHLSIIQTIVDIMGKLVDMVIIADVHKDTVIIKDTDGK